MYDNAYYVEYAIYDVVTKMLRVEGLEDTPLQPQRHGNQAAQRRLQGIHLAGSPRCSPAVQDVITNWSSYPDMRYANDASTQASLGGGEYLDGRAAAVRRGGHELAHGRAGGSRGRTRHAGSEAAAEPRLSDEDAGRLVAQAAVGLRPGVRSGLFAGNAGSESAHSDRGLERRRRAIRTTSIRRRLHRRGIACAYAINKSHNTSAAHVLYEYVGIENSVNVPSDAGHRAGSHSGNRRGTGAGRLRTFR